MSKSPTTTKRPPAAQVAFAKNAPRAPPSIRLLDKTEVLAITNVTFPTVWLWMREGRFPRSRIVGGKSMWLSNEVEAWLAALPVRKLKGDAQEVA
jgi:predicted DNA-binding transcriptional regulator AlpA